LLCAHATRHELAVLARDEERATAALGDSLASVREQWEPETTLRNLTLIRRARKGRQDAVLCVQQIEDALLECAGRFHPGSGQGKPE
jgi:hypothetical protein